MFIKHNCCLIIGDKHFILAVGYLDLGLYASVRVNKIEYSLSVSFINFIVNGYYSTMSNLIFLHSSLQQIKKQASKA